jgi:hypothetical protein
MRLLFTRRKAALLCPLLFATLELSGQVTSPAFLPPKDVALLAHAQPVIRVDDLTGDGRLDIVVLDPEGHSVHVEVQHTDGSFSAAASLATQAFDLDVAAVTDPDREDVVLFLTGGPQLLRVLENGSLEPGPAPASPFPFEKSTPRSLVDLGREGRKAVVAFLDGALWGFSPSATGSLEPTQMMPVDLGNAAGAVLIAGDFNGDGVDDVLATAENYPYHQPPSTILWGDGHGGFSTARGPWFASIKSVAVADFDQDGKADFVYSARMSTALSSAIVSGMARGDSTAGLVVSTLSLTSTPSDAVMAADFDGDGRPDVAVSRDGGTAVYLNQGTSPFLQGRTVVSDSTWRALAVGDIDGDGYPDFIGTSGAHLQVARNISSSSLSDLWVPVVLSASGANGARYETELTIDNDVVFGAKDLRLRYFPEGDGGGGTALLTLPAGGRQVLRPALEDLAALGIPVQPGDQRGALAIEAVDGAWWNISVTARVTSPVAGGNAGVSFPGVPRGGGFDSEAIVGWLRETAEDRSNVAVLNMGGEKEGDVTLRLTVVSTDPAAPGTFGLPQITLRPSQSAQIDRILRQAGNARSGWVRIERTAGKAPFFAYGVVNDEGTSDGSFVKAFDPKRRAASRFTLPAVVETIRYSSDLIVTNTTMEGRSVSFRFVSEALATSDHSARFRLDVPAQGQVFLADLVESLRQQGVEGIGPRGVDYVGALFAEVEGEPTAGLFLGVRTSARKPEGRYGVFYEAVPEDELATRTCRIPAVREDGSVRTNIAIVNAGENRNSFRILVTDPSRRVTGITEKLVSVEPGGWLQIPAILSTLGTELTEARVSITAVESNARFLAYGVTNDGATPGSGTDDPAYLQMTQVQ